MDRARIDSLITQDPRVMAAGWWGAQVYIHLLLINHAHALRGFVPARYAAPEYLARFLGLEAAPFLTAPAPAVTRYALTMAAAVPLIAIEPDGVRLIHRDHWECDSTSRVRRMRARNRDKLAQRKADYIVADAITCSKIEQAEADAQAAICGPGDGGGQRDGAPLPKPPQNQSQGPSGEIERPIVAQGSGIHQTVPPDWLVQSEIFGCNAGALHRHLSAPPPSSSLPPFSPLLPPSQTLPLLSPQNPPSHLASPSSAPHELSTDLSTDEDISEVWSDLEESGLTSGDLELPFDPQWLGQKATIQPVAAKRTKATDRVVSRDAVLQAEMLASIISQRFPNNKVSRLIGARRSLIIARWAEPIERLHRLDLVSWREISATIEWIGRSEFWGKQILSGDNLRKHWDKIQVQRAPARGAREQIPTRGRFEAASGIHKDGEQKL